MNCSPWKKAKQLCTQNMIHLRFTGALKEHDIQEQQQYG